MNEVSVRKEFEEAVAVKIRNMVSRFFTGDGSITCGAFAHEFAWELLTLAKAEICDQQDTKFKIGDKVMPKRLKPGECGMYLDDPAKIVDIVGGYYILENDRAYKIECQDHWELAEKPAYENYENALNSEAVTFLEGLGVVANFYADQIIGAVKHGARWQKQKDNQVFKELAVLASHQDGCLALENIQMRLNELIKED